MNGLALLILDDDLDFACLRAKSRAQELAGLAKPLLCMFFFHETRLIRSPSALEGRIWISAGIPGQTTGQHCQLFTLPSWRLGKVLQQVVNSASRLFPMHWVNLHRSNLAVARLAFQS
jgi:hypothetical protein